MYLAWYLGYYAFDLNIYCLLLYCIFEAQPKYVSTQYSASVNTQIKILLVVSSVKNGIGSTLVYT